jgi:hypothetical protein
MSSIKEFAQRLRKIMIHLRKLGSCQAQATQVTPELLSRMTLYTRIREIVGLNLGRDTGCPDRFFVIVLSPSQNIFWTIILLGHDASFPILSNSFSSDSPTTQRSIVLILTTS